MRKINEIAFERDEKAPINYVILCHTCDWFILSDETLRSEEKLARAPPS